jgi:hypothetical protein
MVHSGRVIVVFEIISKCHRHNFFCALVNVHMGIHALYITPPRGGCSAVAVAFDDLDIIHKSPHPKPLLVWYDTIDYGFDLVTPATPDDKFSKLRFYQIINRIPGINTLCRKVSLSQVLRRAQLRFPNAASLYSFIPATYIFPAEFSAFLRQHSGHDRMYVIKTDNGSLGDGVRFISQDDTVESTADRSVAQEYIESMTLDDRKFDFRIYVLISSITPLHIYVYNEGLARFCAQKVTGTGGDPKLRLCTNTAVNRGHADITSLTQPLSEVIDRVATERNIDVKTLWNQIDELIVLTILAGYDYLLAAQTRALPSTKYPRSFQILGFDVLLDQNCKPALIEVNYRPSLSSDVTFEHELKRDLLKDTLKIVLPPDGLQHYIDNAGAFNPDATPPEFLKPPTNFGRFRRIFASDIPSNTNHQWTDIFNQVKLLKPEMDGDGKPNPAILGSGPSQMRTARGSLTVAIRPRNEFAFRPLNPLPLTRPRKTVAPARVGVGVTMVTIGAPIVHPLPPPTNSKESRQSTRPRRMRNHRTFG